MRQVPRQAGKTVPYLLVGNGRVAKHLARYLTLAGVPHLVWKNARSLDRAFLENLVEAERIWILVSDSAIRAVADRIRECLFDVGISPEDGPALLHASGATVVDGVRGVHPLMTFGPEFYDLATYSRIPFVAEDLSDGVSAQEILSPLSNAVAFLPPQKRALYHALVSVGGNFPALLWADVFERFERDLGLSRDLLVPFLFRTLLNVIERGESALTGPLVRGDHATIRRHREALTGTELIDLYGAFEKFVAPDSSVRTAMTQEMNG